MYTLKNLKKAARQYKTEFKDILSEYNIVNIDRDKIILKNEDNETFVVTYDNNIVDFKSENKYLVKDIKLILPKDNKKHMSKIIETRIEKRKSGIIIDYIVKTYDYLNLSDEIKQVNSLISNRYVLKNKDYDIEYLTNLNNMESIKKQSCMTTNFVSYILNCDKSKPQIKLYIKEKNSYKNSIIGLYDKMKGNNILTRIYDLYNGNITKNNFFDILKINSKQLSIDCFDYKTKNYITQKENEIVGKSKIEKSKSELNLINKLLIEYIEYKLPVDVYNRNSLVNAITYRLNPTEKAKQIIQTIFDMPYQDFIMLDDNEQAKLVESIKNRKQYKFIKKL